MKVRPLSNRVLIKRLEAERTTAAGIVIPDTAGEKPTRGEVIAVGPGKKNDKGEVQPMNLNAGDIVLFGQYSGSTVKIDGEELLMMAEDDVYAVIEK